MELARWLKSADTTQSAFAARLGVSQGRISQIIAGAAPSFELAARIAEETGGEVSPDDLGVKGFAQGAQPMSQSTLDSVESAIAAIGRGELIVVVDDDDRENEGDLIGAASRITPEQMAFMIRNCCGIVCTPMTLQDARRLKLDPMVAMNDAPLGTAFTVSVDYKDGLTTGISAMERCATVHALANGNVQAGDFVRPGHVFPLIAKEGGVLIRSGHTEAAVDLARLAGEPPVGVICELVNDDGTVKRGPQVSEFARANDLRIISVADLIAYRRSRERLVEKTGQFSVETPNGPARGIAYSTPFDPVQHLAMVFGDIGNGGKPVAVRLHREDVADDVFGNRRVLRQVYDIFGREKSGILVYLREGTAGVPALRFGSREEREATASAQSRDDSWRDIGLGAQILRDLGVKSIRLISSSKRHYVGIDGFGLEIVDTIPLSEES